MQHQTKIIPICCSHSCSFALYTLNFFINIYIISLTFVHCCFENWSLLMYLDSVNCRINKQQSSHLPSYNSANAFEGDVLVTYSPSQNKNQNSPIKTNILHANVVDKDGEMTITASVNDNLIKWFSSFLQPGKSVWINKFGLKQKVNMNEVMQNIQSSCWKTLQLV